MTKIKKTDSDSDKEKELLNKISEAKKKLAKIQDKKKYEIGELAYKYGLNEFDLTLLEKSFKDLGKKLSETE